MSAVIEVKLKSSGRKYTLKGPDGIKFSVDSLKSVPSDVPLLLRNLPKWEHQVIFPALGNNPLVPACIASYNPSAQIRIHQLDSHDFKAAGNTLDEYENISSYLNSDMQPGNLADKQIAIVMIGRNSDRLLCFDILERLNKTLSKESQVLVLVHKKRQKDFIKKLTKNFSKGQVIDKDREAFLFRGFTDPQKDVWTPRKSFVDVDAIGAEMTMSTRPGVFSHGRVDVGGLALYETMELAPCETLLELGCGAGLVGLLGARRNQKTHGSHEGEMVLVDSYSRAIDCASENAAKLGVENVSCLLEDDYQEERAFDVVVGNPPYYANHRIAEYFIEVAARVLEEGGRLYLVSKHGKTIEEMAEGKGFSCETVRRRNYDVLLAVKRY